MASASRLMTDTRPLHMKRKIDTGLNSNPKE
jgi:hypothetical protein